MEDDVREQCVGCMFCMATSRNVCRRCSRNYKDRFLEVKEEDIGTAKVKRKMSRRDVEIRKRYVEEKRTYEELAIEYGISKQRVAQIVNEMRSGSEYRGKMICRAKMWRDGHGKSVSWIAQKLKIPPLEVMEILRMSQEDIDNYVRRGDSRRRQAS